MGGSEDLLLFAHLVRKPDSELDLERAALLVAEAEYPGLDIARYVASLDELGQRVRPRLAALGIRPGRPRTAGVVAAATDRLLDFLYREVGFRGNAADYYDPRNSYLNDVIDRRLGNPISLAIVLMGVGRRAGLALDGVSFPGHFLARAGGEGGPPLFIDPFEGRLLSRELLHALWDQTTGSPGNIEASALAPAGTRQILARVLNNLRAIHEVRGDGPRLCQVLARLCAVNPTDETRSRLERAQTAILQPRLSIN